MQEGKGFEEACSELEQTPASIPNFSLATRTLDGLTDRRVTVSWLQDLAFAMDPGTLSDVSQTSEGAGILFLKSLKQPMRPRWLRSWVASPTSSSKQAAAKRFRLGSMKSFPPFSY